MKRHGLNFAPEVSPELGQKVYGGGQTISMGGGTPKNILPYSSKDNASGKGRSQVHPEFLKKAAAVVGAVWIGGVLLGFEWMWPVYMVLDVLRMVLSIPPFSWFFGWIWTPLSWIFGWMNRGAPLVEQTGALQELRLPTDQVSSYMDAYVNQYGDAALIFATHDGYPQIVTGLLFNRDLGMRELIDATDDNGNTALIYAAAKGFRQCSAILLRSGADPDTANHGNGGRTPLMEAAGSGHKDIVTAIRLSKATVDAVDDFGNTALHYAAYHGHLAVVQELLKSNPRRDLKNSYGHTAASYAAANRHKGIADLINRFRPRPEKEVPEKDKEKGEEMDKDKAKDKDKDKDKEGAFDLEALFGGKKAKEEKHVKGGAEDLHKRDWKDFAPKLEKLVSGVTDSERKSLEDQIAKLKRANEEAELKAQKRIVELLERSSGQQKAVEDAEREARALHLNATELSLKVQELQARHQASELRTLEEKQRADRLHEEVQRAQLDLDRHKSRADGAERERDLHVDASKRHEDEMKRKHEEVSGHLTRIEQQSREMSSLRSELQRKEDELRRHQESISSMQRELGVRGGASAPERREDP
eukprot:CAMPEP_0168393146 /NCGR_PEP_ID=MMETSP0228-20121227/18865_1 /TAXON_ID=133427 /ORGANISM="Protoceratium reticulatum, Strain CCCM 535 (=CCMP 1889)" /LENGTH=586 /DNA_ID=CAMNT_0008406513 /DNA_START=46 /DNA_END=1802 /DNA_ORIENTATION=+